MKKLILLLLFTCPTFVQDFHSFFVSELYVSVQETENEILWKEGRRLEWKDLKGIAPKEERGIKSHRASTASQI